MALTERYFAPPDVLLHFSPMVERGLIALGCLGLLSFLSTFVLLVWITHRFASWRSHYRTYVGYNQYVLLIYQLLLADLIQALAFVISFHWVSIGKILAPTPACFTQAWLLHLGDVSSGAFVLAIAVHTWLGVVKGYKPSYKVFVTAICCIWLFALLLTAIGPLKGHMGFFARAGSWCWVSVRYENDRLWLHYLWIFIYEFGTMLIYGHIFFHLRGRLKSIISHDRSTTKKLNEATQYMILYPAVYVILTLPLATGRMATMSGHNLPDSFYIVAGCLLTSCGLIDAAVYTITRRVLVSHELASGAARTATKSGHGTYHHQGSQPSAWDVQSFDNREISNRVVITGGNKRYSKIDESYPMPEVRTATVTKPGKTATLQKPESQTALRSTSPTGSMDSMIKPPSTEFGQAFARIKAETKIEIGEPELVTDGDRASSDTITVSPGPSDTKSIEFPPHTRKNSMR